MEEHRESGRLLWGLVLVVLGLMFLLSNFGYGWWWGWGRWWPLLLIALGVWLLFRDAPPAQTPPPPEASPAPVRRRSPTGAIMLIGIGLAFLLEDVIGGRAFPAVVLIAIGVALLLRDRGAP